jgi:small subunit ribosomal protein S2
MKELLESGVHFGHQTRRWDPRMKPYIYTQRKGIHILDLQKTVEYVEKAYNYVKEQVAKGATVLFVGTKKQAQEAIEKEANRCDMPYVNFRWLGGCLTNFTTVMKSKQKLEECESILESPERQKNYTKKELQSFRKTRERINKLLSGIRKLDRLPDMLFVIDPTVEETAVLEARKLKIPIVAVVDTNCNPMVIDHPIPGNDDAIRAVNLFTSVIANAVINGRKELQMNNEGEEMPRKEDLSNVAYVSRVDKGSDEDIKETSFSADATEAAPAAAEPQDESYLEETVSQKE